MIFLVGFMGSGKSTVGPELARRLNCSFLDLDDRIIEAAGCPIAEIFDRLGEAAFREIEHRELARLLDEQGTGETPASTGEVPAASAGAARLSGFPPGAGEQTSRSRSQAGVVALGGGAFAEERNVALLEARGAATVWLDAPADVLLQRCAQHGADRPLARDAGRFFRLHRERLPFYARARVRVNAAAPVENVVEEILRAV